MPFALRVLWPLVATSILTLAASCEARSSRSADSAAADMLPVSSSAVACPLDSFRVVIGSRTITHIPIAGRAAHIPEFHDCQRFIAPAGGRYDSAYAIFASQNSEGGGAATPSPAGTSAVQGQIYSWGGTYGALGIEPHFNCLFLWPDDTVWRARMVPVGTNENGCDGGIPADTTVGTTLQVRRVVIPPFSSPDDYPPVARWDMDRSGSTQIVGIGCGAGWCYVGPYGFAPPLTLPSTGPLGLRRVRTIDGWHDEQRLSIPGPAGAVGAGLTPTTLMGHAFPDTLLEQRQPAEFDAGWVPVSTIELSGGADGRIYTSKLNLSTGVNQVFLRKAPGTMRFKALIISASGDSVEFAVKRHGHEGFQAATGLRIVGITRWRWLEDDETLWTRCLEGCCEVIRK